MDFNTKSEVDELNIAFDDGCTTENEIKDTELPEEIHSNFDYQKIEETLKSNSYENSKENDINVMSSAEKETEECMTSTIETFGNLESIFDNISYDTGREECDFPTVDMNNEVNLSNNIEKTGEGSEELSLTEAENDDDLRVETPSGVLELRDEDHETSTNGILLQINKDETEELKCQNMEVSEGFCSFTVIDECSDNSDQGQIESPIGTYSQGALVESQELSENESIKFGDGGIEDIENEKAKFDDEANEPVENPMNIVRDETSQICANYVKTVDLEESSKRPTSNVSLESSSECSEIDNEKVDNKCIKAHSHTDLKESFNDKLYAHALQQDSPDPSTSNELKSTKNLLLNETSLKNNPISNPIQNLKINDTENEINASTDSLRREHKAESLEYEGTSTKERQTHSLSSANEVGADEFVVVDCVNSDLEDDEYENCEEEADISTSPMNNDSEDEISSYLDNIRKEMKHCYESVRPTSINESISNSKLTNLIEIPGEDIENGIFTRIVIIANSAFEDVSLNWPTESSVKPFYLLARNMIIDNIMETFINHEYLSGSGKILLIVMLDPEEIILLKRFKFKYCESGHLPISLPSSTQFKSYVGLSNLLVRLQKMKKEFEKQLSVSSMLFSYLPEFNLSENVKAVMESMELNDQSCNCSDEVLNEIEEAHERFTDFSSSFNQLVHIKNLNMTQDSKIFEYLPPPVHFMDDGWKIKPNSSSLVGYAETCHIMLKKFMYDSSSAEDIEQSDSEKLHNHLDYINSRIIRNYDEFKVLVIGDSWLKVVANSWSKALLNKPLICYKEMISLTDMSKIIDAFVNPNERTLVIATLPSKNILEYRQCYECNGHNPLFYPVPKHSMLNDPGQFVREFLKSVTYFHRDIKSRMKNLKIVYTTCYPIIFELYYKYLALNHAKTTGHILASRFVSNAVCNNFRRQIRKVHVLLNTFVNKFNRSEGVKDFCNIHYLMSNFSAPRLIFPVYVPSLSPDIECSEELARYFMSYVSQVVEVLKSRTIKWENEGRKYLDVKHSKAGDSRNRESRSRSSIEGEKRVEDHENESRNVKHSPFISSPSSSLGKESETGKTQGSSTATEKVNDARASRLKETKHVVDKEDRSSHKVSRYASDGKSSNISRYSKYSSEKIDDHSSSRRASDKPRSHDSHYHRRSRSRSIERRSQYPKTHSRLHSRRRSRSRDRHRSRSTDRHRSRSTDRHRSRSRDRHRSRSTDRHRSRRHKESYRRSRSRDRYRRDSTRSRSKSKKISRRYSRSLSFGRLSPERSRKVNEEEALASLWKIHNNECEMYRKNPSAHPDYDRCRRMWLEVMGSQGYSMFDPSLESKWYAYWVTKVETLFKSGWEEKRAQCLTMLNSKISKKKLEQSSDDSKPRKKSRFHSSSGESSEGEVEDGSSKATTSKNYSSELLPESKLRSFDDLESRIQNFFDKTKENSICDSKVPLDVRDKEGILSVTSILSQISDKLGTLGLSLSLLHRKVNDSVKANEDPMCHIDNDAQMLLSLANDKIKAILTDDDLSVIKRAIIQEASNRLVPFIQSLQKEDKKTNDYGIDINIIAKATLGKQVKDIILFIKNALAYHKIENVPNEKLMQMYLEVRDIHMKTVSRSSFETRDVSIPEKKTDKASAFMKPHFSHENFVLSAGSSNESIANRKANMKEKFMALPMHLKINKFSEFYSLSFEEKSVMLSYLDDLEKTDHQFALSLRCMIKKK